MADAAERLVNLAMLLASGRPVTAARVREEVFGYPEDQDDVAFARMFERDKDELRAAGLSLVSSKRETDDVETYVLDLEATHLRRIELEPGEADVLSTAVAALVDDPSFPFREELRTAAMKVLGRPVPKEGRTAALLADESPESQAGAVALLMRASMRRKTVSFAYVNAAGGRSERALDPYGLFLLEGRWYAVGHDHQSGEVRVFTVSRMTGPAETGKRPKHPDFEVPEGFDIASYRLLPFQYGPDRREGTVRFTKDAAWRAGGLTGGKGVLSPQGDGSVLWRVEVADDRELARWVVENGPGLEIVAPEEAREALRHGIAEAVRANG